MSDSSSEDPNKKDKDSINDSGNNKITVTDNRETVRNTIAASATSTTARPAVDTTTESVSAAIATAAVTAAATETTETPPAEPLPPPPPTSASTPAGAVSTDRGEMAQSQTQQQQQQKRQFLLFIKILFKILDQNHDVTVEKREAARAIVADCTRRNRLGDPAFIPLMAAVDARLRRHLGEQHWRKAHMYMRHYMNREAARTRLPLPVGSKTAAV
mmetsp:Transcript_23207/g.55026  ORF Transcript_23207/g.55026 Transcript_23207/m.55026 type:complete len:215 (-) Transcript_23207:313-957(-)